MRGERSWNRGNLMIAGGQQHTATDDIYPLPRSSHPRQLEPKGIAAATEHHETWRFATRKWRCPPLDVAPHFQLGTPFGGKNLNEFNQCKLQGRLPLSKLSLVRSVVLADKKPFTPLCVERGNGEQTQ